MAISLNFLSLLNNSLGALTNCVQVSYHTRVQLPRNKFEIKPAPKRRGGVCCIKFVAQANSLRWFVPKAKAPQRKQLSQKGPWERSQHTFITRARLIPFGAARRLIIFWFTSRLTPACPHHVHRRRGWIYRRRGCFFSQVLAHTHHAMGFFLISEGKRQPACLCAENSSQSDFLPRPPAALPPKGGNSIRAAAAVVVDDYFDLISFPDAIWSSISPLEPRAFVNTARESTPTQLQSGEKMIVFSPRRRRPP